MDELYGARDLRVAERPHVLGVLGRELGEPDPERLRQHGVGEPSEHGFHARRVGGRDGGQKLERRCDPRHGTARGAPHVQHRRQRAQDRIGGVALERKAAADELGALSVAAVAQAAVAAPLGGEDVLEERRRRARGVAHPVPRPGRQDDEVAARSGRGASSPSTSSQQRPSVTTWKLGLPCASTPKPQGAPMCDRQ